MSRIGLLVLLAFPSLGQEAWRTDWAAFRDALQSCFTSSQACIKNASANFTGSVTWAGTYIGAGSCPISMDVNGFSAPCFRVQVPRTDAFTAFGDSYFLSIILSVTPTNAAEWQKVTVGSAVRVSSSSVQILAAAGLIPPIAVGIFQSSLVPAPQITGVGNGASFVPGVVPNSWITIQGTNLSAATDTWDKAIANGSLPTTLDGVSVSVGGNPAYVSYVSSNQVNAIAPDVGMGAMTVTVNSSGVPSSTVSVTSLPVQPAFFLLAGKYPVATRLDYSVAAKNGTIPNLSTTPAKPGDVIILWGTGFGPTNPPAPTGVQLPADVTYLSATPVTVTVGEVDALVYGAALAPGFAALYQVAIQIPPTAPAGDLELVATVNGSRSPATLITVAK